MEEIKIGFSNCNVNIEKMFDIHDNDNVINNTNIITPAKSKPAKPKTLAAKTVSDKPQTLTYYKHGNNGILTKQHKRVDIVFRKWTEWGWIDEDVSATDFDAFFEGQPRYCNIVWKANTTILTILLQELLKQDYIENQTGLKAKSLVKNQFRKSPSSDRSRIDTAVEDKIVMTLYILDIHNPLPLRLSSENLNDFDTSDAAFMEILSGYLHSSKSV